jgi:hypothetical protein
MATLIVEVVSVAKTFPAGTVEEVTTVVLSDAAGPVETQVVTGPVVTFTDVPAGEYTVEATKNGVSTGPVAVTVAASDVTIFVPSGLKITVTP